MTVILDAPHAAAIVDPKPPLPDPAGEPPIEEPGDTPPEREEPDDEGTTSGDAPMIA